MITLKFKEWTIQSHTYLDSLKMRKGLLELKDYQVKLQELLYGVGHTWRRGKIVFLSIMISLVSILLSKHVQRERELKQHNIVLTIKMS